MSASDVIREIESLPPDQLLDWASISERLNAEFDAAATSQDRGDILAVRAAAIELVEEQLELHHDQLEKFIDLTDLEYKQLIAREARVDNAISFDKMLSVTDREIAAGRMSEDFALRQIAKEETGRVDAPPPEPIAGAGSSSAFDKLKHWLHIDT